MDKYDIDDIYMVLNLDIGFNATGWSTFCCDRIAGMGIIRPEKFNKKTIKLNGGVAKDDYRRCVFLYQKIRELINEYDPDIVIGEAPHGGSKSSRAGRCMGMALAVVSGACAHRSVELISPRDVKLAVTGKPKADKDEIINAVINHYGWSMRKVGKGFKIHCICNKAGLSCSCQSYDHVFNKGDFEHIADSIGVYWAFLKGRGVDSG